MFGRLIIVTSFFVAGIAGSAHATTMIALDLKALVAQADRVVDGTVESTECRWTTSRDAIFTDVKLRVSRVYKGAVKPGDLITVRREGGVVGGIGMKVFGAASFVPGEEAVVFLEQRAGSAWVVGMAQGKLRVTTQADGTRLVAPPDVGGIHFLGNAPAAPRAVRLEELEKQIRAFVVGSAQ
jgi:hypothetical protein